MLALAVILGVTLTIGIDLSFRSAHHQLDQTLVEAAGSIDIVVRSSRRPFKVSKLDPIRDIPGIVAVSPRVVQIMPVYVKGYEGEVYIVGITRNDFDFQDEAYTHIQGIRDLTREKTCVVDERIGKPEIDRFLHIYTYEETKHGTKTTDFTYSIVGILKPHKISISTRDLYSAYIDIDSARFIFNKAERDLPYTYNDYHVDYAIVKVSNIAEGPRVADEIRRTLGPGFTTVALKESLLNQYKDTLEGLKNGLNLTQKLSLILVAVITFNTGLANIEERTREIGIIRALGASQIQVFQIFLLETFTVCLLASLTGTGTGIVFGHILLKHVLAPLLTTELSLSIDPIAVLWGLQTVIAASATGGIFPAILATRSEITSSLSTAPSPNRRSHTSMLLLGLLLVGTSQYHALPSPFHQLESISEATWFPILIMASLVVGWSCIFAYLIHRTGNTIGTILSFPFYQIGPITGRSLGRKIKRTLMCLILLSTSMSFLITMSGIETNLVQGVEKSLGGLLATDLIVVSDNNFEKELTEKILDLRGEVDVEVATPIYADRQILYNSGDYRKYNTEGTLMFVEPEFFEISQLKFSPDTPSDPVPLLLNEPKLCIMAQSLAGTLNTETGDNVAIMVSETRYDDSGNEYVENVLEKLRIVGLLETISLQYFNVGGTPLDKVAITTYSNWGYLHPGFRYEDERVKEDNSEEQDLATLILIKTKPGADLGETQEAILEEFEDTYDIEKILTREDLAQEYRNRVDTIFNVFRGTFALSLGVTTLGVSQVLFVNLRERRREFGLLKAIGMSEIQLVLMILFEAIFLVATSFVIGCVGGYLSWDQIAKTMGLGGFPIPALLETEKIKYIFTIVLATSFASAAYPILMLRRLSPKELLQKKGG